MVVVVVVPLVVVLLVIIAPAPPPAPEELTVVPPCDEPAPIPELELEAVVSDELPSELLKLCPHAAITTATPIVTTALLTTSC